MGTLAFVLGIAGICIGWLPNIGWIGFAMGWVSCVLAVLSVTHWYMRQGYLASGIAGIVLGETAIIVSFSYQIKHAGGRLDVLFHSLPLPVAYYCIGISAGCIAIGLLVARFKTRFGGVLITVIAIVALALSGGWTLVAADREFSQATHARNQRN